MTRRAFAVRFEWRRLAQLVVIIGGVAAAGELLLPTSGAVGFLTRAAAFLVIPVLLYLTRFAHDAELRQAGQLLPAARSGRRGRG